jgi:hypothetical protein
MDAVNKKAISITRIGFIMLQCFHSVSSGSGFSYLCSSANNWTCVVFFMNLFWYYLTYWWCQFYFYHSPCLKAVAVWLHIIKDVIVQFFLYYNLYFYLYSKWYLFYCSLPIINPKLDKSLLITLLIFVHSSKLSAPLRSASSYVANLVSFVL